MESPSHTELPLRVTWRIQLRNAYHPAFLHPTTLMGYDTGWNDNVEDTKTNPAPWPPFFPYFPFFFLFLISHYFLFHIFSHFSHSHNFKNDSRKATQSVNGFTQQATTLRDQTSNTKYTPTQPAGTSQQTVPIRTLPYTGPPDNPRLRSGIPL